MFFLFCVCRISGCLLRGAANRPSEAGVLDETGLPGDPQGRSQEQRGSGVREAAVKINTHQTRCSQTVDTHTQKDVRNTVCPVQHRQHCVCHFLTDFPGFP